MLCNAIISIVVHIHVLLTFFKLQNLFFAPITLVFRLTELGFFLFILVSLNRGLLDDCFGGTCFTISRSVVRQLWIQRFRVFEVFLFFLCTFCTNYTLRIASSGLHYITHHHCCCCDLCCEYFCLPLLRNSSTNTILLTLSFLLYLDFCG